MYDLYDLVAYLDFYRAPCTVVFILSYVTNGRSGFRNAAIYYYERAEETLTLMFYDLKNVHSSMEQDDDPPQATTIEQRFVSPLYQNIIFGMRLFFATLEACFVSSSSSSSSSSLLSLSSCMYLEPLLRSSFFLLKRSCRSRIWARIVASKPWP